MKTLVAYFSASGVTAKVATLLASCLDADLFEIVPEVPYTKDDLNWMNPLSRSSIEMKDKTSRPNIIDKNAHMEAYDVIYLGFPIWWYVAPTIINTFLEQYDFANKKIILFATSGGSGFGQTINELQPSVSSSTMMIEGRLLNGMQTKESINAWLNAFNR